jgi:hypothetical protein
VELILQIKPQNLYIKTFHLIRLTGAGCALSPIKDEGYGKVTVLEKHIMGG